MGGSWPTAATTVAGVIGDPVVHSLSPVLHNAAFRSLGLDWVYVAFEVPPGRSRAAIEGARSLGIAGLSVTMPHKGAVARQLTQLSPVARRLQAVNTVVRRDDGELVGENTDGEGFLDALRLDAGLDPAGARAVVIGAGGAGRAVVLALAGAGASEVVVVNRSAENGRGAAALAGGVGRPGVQADVAGADLVVNATPLGMSGALAGALPLDPGALREGQTVVDLVYLPRETPLLEAARAKGAGAVGGLGMLVHQAARAFQLWTGREAPLADMRRAADAALGQDR